jgi:hypothetical protein
VRTRAEGLAVLVRAPAGLVHAVLRDVDGWPGWWTGCRTARPAPADAAAVLPDGVTEASHHRLDVGVGWRRLRCRAVFHGWRQDEGMRVALRDGADADAEWWFEPVDAGTVVHLLVTARGRSSQRVVRGLGEGLQALKDHLELVVDVATGRVP